MLSESAEICRPPIRESFCYARPLTAYSLKDIVSINPDFYSSRFARWSEEQVSSNSESLPALRARALQLLVASVKHGEIVSIDGIDSPLSLRILAHHGEHEFEMNSHWIASSQTWVCPCCERSKYLISRLGKKNRILAKLVIHHDHMSQALEAAFRHAFEQAGTKNPQVKGQQLVERIAVAFAAYPDVLICEDCNNADAEAKKLLGAPGFFLSL